jgi:uncharacterized membrane protein/glutaredoxin
MAVAGVVLTAYLSAVAWMHSTLPACGAGSDCEIVQSSRWSVLLGLPIAAWGCMTYTLLAALAWRMRHRPGSWRAAWLVAALATGVSLYLTAVSAFELRATCAWCLASAALTMAIFVALALARPQAPPCPWRAWGPTAALVAGLAAGLLHLHYGGVFDPAAGPEKPHLRALAEHLERRGAKFYGAYWCPHCQDQKRLFEASAHRLPYVECSPGGRNAPRATDCQVNGITSYPTWVIDGRRFERVLEPRTLALYTQFEWSSEKP